MTTPLCDCPDNMGWGTQADYTTAYGTATATITNAQGIYCVNGSPVVAPRGGFRTDWTEARVDNDPGGTIGIQVTPTDLRSGATVVDSILTNPYPYPMQFYAFIEWTLLCNLVDNQSLLMRMAINKDGATELIYTNWRHIGYTATDRQFLHDRWSYPLPQLAPGTSMTIGMYPQISVNVANLGGYWESFGSAMRFIGGTTPPPY